MLTFDDRDKPPYPKAQANKIKSKFLDLAYFNGKYIVYVQRPHFQERLRQRKLTINDAISILKTGLIIKEPEYEGGEWRYRVDKGKLVSKSGTGSLVITFCSRTELHLQTIF